MTSRGTLFTVAAPSGAGKTSLVKALVDSIPNTCVSISHTTRAIRPGEKEGVNYHFVTESTFKAMLEGGSFLEHAKVYSNMYGTSRNWVEQQLDLSLDVILEIDWQGAQQIRSLVPDVVSISLLPPSRQTLYNRLTDRGQDNNKTIDARMAEAINEMSHYDEADYVIVNDDFQVALNDLSAVVLSQRLRLKSQRRRHKQLLKELLS